MAVSAHQGRFWPAEFLLLALLGGLVGCREADKIQTYAAPKEPKPAVAVAEAETRPLQGPPTDRMLTAIVPAGEQAWFFKAIGPLLTVDQHEKELSEFFTTIHFAEDGKPKWQLPTGWKEEASNNAMRFATIVVPAEPKPLEVTVSALPWSGTADDLLRNVNRWRGQLQLPPVDSGHVAESTRESKAGDLPITIVDLRGHFAGSGMAPPFAGPMTANSAQPASGPELPPGHPPIGSTSANSPSTAEKIDPQQSAAPAAAAGAPTFTAPSEWQPLAAGGMRKAAFAVGDAAHGALVTLIDFPADAGPMIADPLPNINRWRREVGLPETQQGDIEKATEKIEVDGQPATLVRAIPEASQSGQSQAKTATLAVMAKFGNQIWFIKLTGDRSVVAAQEANFKSFLKSLRFAPSDGASDGHN
jgi:hypothetical protein